MDELLIFKDNQTGDNVGMYYNTWLLIIKCILIEYAYKTTEEANEVLKKHYYKKPKSYYEVLYLSHETEYHWAMLGAYGELYWLKGVSSQAPIDYDTWYNSFIRNNNLPSPFQWF
jgi:hypothetical protein